MGWDNGLGWDEAALGISLWEMGEKPAGFPLLEPWEGGRQGCACPDPLVDTDFQAGMSDPAGIQFCPSNPVDNHQECP